MFFNSRTNRIIKKYQLNRTFSYVWGMKTSGLQLRNKISKGKLKYLEDGFVHSYGKKKSNIPLAIALDSGGIYYNSSSRSQLFSLVKKKLNSKNLLRTRRIIRL